MPSSFPPLNDNAFKNQALKKQDLDNAIGIIICNKYLLLRRFFMSGSERREFRAEVRKVLHILTNSLYTNREIFLRELISNASDALDKLRYRSNRGETPRLPETPLEIRITLDKDARTLTIADTGVGMTPEELADNLGTIARSGSEAFLADLPQREGKEGEPADASNIIGRFGVGFYAVFMVAERVEVTSRPAFAEGDPAAWRWSSDGLGTFAVEECAGDGPARGTVIVAHLKEDAAEFLEPYRVRSVILRHSAFVPFPVLVDGERVNTQPALWREPRTSIKQEDYDAFYRHLTGDAADPLDVLHISVDAPVQFNALLYVPASPQDFFGADRDFWGLDLYARRVLIQHRNKEVIPDWLAFLKGVVDTEDLPLNISRETLQENLVLMKISQTITRQMLGHLEKMAADRPDVYERFWKLHGKVFKLSYQDFALRERVAALMRFNSSRLDSGDALTGLDACMERAPEGQKTFWYLSAPNREAALLSPHLERFRRKGLEVLFLYEPMDEFVMEGLGSYKEWKFKAVENAADGDLDAFADKENDTPAAPPLSEDDTRAFDGLLERIREILGDRVAGVRVSHRLADSPAVLVAADGGMTSGIEKLFRAMNKDASVPVKTLELNRDHPLLRNLLRIFKADPQDKALAGMAELLFEGCLLREGYVNDPQLLAGHANALMEQAAAWYAEIRKL